MGFRFNKKATPASPAASKAELYYSSTLSPAALAAVDESGNIARVAGFTTKDYRLIRVVDVTASPFTPTSGAQALYVECWGGGGAGGGGVTGTTATSAGSGGGSGAYSAIWVTGTLKASYTVVLGAAGTPGAAGNVVGGNGGDTTFDSPSICTAKGGIGGNGGAAAAITALIVLGGAGGAAASGVGDLKLGGEAGGFSNRASATIANTGRGGNIAGGGAPELIAQGTGNAGTGFGAGGGGGMSLNGGASVAGGAGTVGVIRVWEFA